MARKQVLVQLDDRLVKRLDREARRNKVSRSEFIRSVLNRWFDARETARLERQYREGYRRIPEDPVWTETLGRIAAEMAPPYETD
jgi:metal-responsive CopG/Arc/MetJ family transcriptional regulator